MKAPRIVKPKVGRVAFNEGSGRWVWECSSCHRQGYWGEAWSWCGDWLNAETNSFEWVACSDECAAKAPKRVRALPRMEATP